MMLGLPVNNLFLVFVALSVLQVCNAAYPKQESSEYEQNFQGRLIEDLLARYGQGHIRPVYNTSTMTKVIFRQKIHELIELDARNQRITISVQLKQVWRDEFLHWNQSEYGGIAKIQLPSEFIWVPDITLHRNIDSEFERIKNTMAAITSDGTVTWFAPAIFTSSCRINVKYFPFDIQTCDLRFSSWAYNGFEVDLHPETGNDSLQNSFLENGVWDLLEVHAEREVQMYTCCPEPYPELVYTLVLRRRASFYISYLILPCVFLSALSLLVFYLPAESGEKLSLSITNLLALVVFQQLVAESMPPSGDDPPLIGDYFLSMISMVCLSVVTTVLVIHISAEHGRFPYLVHLVFLRILSRLICMHKEEFDQLPPKTGKIMHDSSTVESSLKLLNTENSIDGKVMMRNKSDDSRNGCAVPDSVIDDLHFIRRDIEDKNADELIEMQWKHVGRVLDRCLLLIFFVYTLVTSAVLISRARGPVEYHQSEPEMLHEIGDVTEIGHVTI